MGKIKKTKLKNKKTKDNTNNSKSSGDISHIKDSFKISTSKNKNKLVYNGGRYYRKNVSINKKNKRTKNYVNMRTLDAINTYGSQLKTQSGGFFTFIKYWWNMRKIKKIIGNLGKNQVEINKFIDSYKVQPETFKRLGDKKALVIYDIIRTEKEKAIAEFLLNNKNETTYDTSNIEHDLKMIETKLNITTKEQLKRFEKDINKELPKFQSNKNKFLKDSEKFRDINKAYSQLIAFYEEQKEIFDKYTKLEGKDKLTDSDKEDRKKYLKNKKNIDHILSYKQDDISALNKNVQDISTIMNMSKDYEAKYQALKEGNYTADLNKWRSNYKAIYANISTIEGGVKHVSGAIEEVKLLVKKIDHHLGSIFGAIKQNIKLDPILKINRILEENIGYLKTIKDTTVKGVKYAFIEQIPIEKIEVFNKLSSAALIQTEVSMTQLHQSLIIDEGYIRENSMYGGGNSGGHSHGGSSGNEMKMIGGAKALTYEELLKLTIHTFLDESYENMYMTLNKINADLRDNAFHSVIFKLNNSDFLKIIKIYFNMTIFFLYYSTRNNIDIASNRLSIVGANQTELSHFITIIKIYEKQIIGNYDNKFDNIPDILKAKLQPRFSGIQNLFINAVIDGLIRFYFNHPRDPNNNCIENPFSVHTTNSIKNLFFCAHALTDDLAIINTFLGYYDKKSSTITKYNKAYEFNEKTMTTTDYLHNNKKYNKLPLIYEKDKDTDNYSFVDIYYNTDIDIIDKKKQDTIGGLKNDKFNEIQAKFNTLNIFLRHNAGLNIPNNQFTKFKKDLYDASKYIEESSINQLFCNKDSNVEFKVMINDVIKTAPYECEITGLDGSETQIEWAVNFMKNKIITHWDRPFITNQDGGNIKTVMKKTLLEAADAFTNFIVGIGKEVAKVLLEHVIIGLDAGEKPTILQVAALNAIERAGVAGGFLLVPTFAAQGAVAVAAQPAIGNFVRNYTELSRETQKERIELNKIAEIKTEIDKITTGGWGALPGISDAAQIADKALVFNNTIVAAIPAIIHAITSIITLLAPGGAQVLIDAAGVKTLLANGDAQVILTALGVEIENLANAGGGVNPLNVAVVALLPILGGGANVATIATRLKNSINTNPEILKSLSDFIKQDVKNIAEVLAVAAHIAFLAPPALVIAQPADAEFPSVVALSSVLAFTLDNNVNDKLVPLATNSVKFRLLRYAEPAADNIIPAGPPNLTHFKPYFTDAPKRDWFMKNITPLLLKNIYNNIAEIRAIEGFLATNDLNPAVVAPTPINDTTKALSILKNDSHHIYIVLYKHLQTDAAIRKYIKDNLDMQEYYFIWLECSGKLETDNFSKYIEQLYNNTKKDISLSEFNINTEFCNYPDATDKALFKTEYDALFTSKVDKIPDVFTTDNSLYTNIDPTPRDETRLALDLPQNTLNTDSNNNYPNTNPNFSKTIQKDIITKLVNLKAKDDTKNIASKYVKRIVSFNVNNWNRSVNSVSQITPKPAKAPTLLTDPKNAIDFINEYLPNTDVLGFLDYSLYPNPVLANKHIDSRMTPPDHSKDIKVDNTYTKDHIKDKLKLDEFIIKNDNYDNLISKTDYLDDNDTMFLGKALYYNKSTTVSNPDTLPHKKNDIDSILYSQVQINKKSIGLYLVNLYITNTNATIKNLLDTIDDNKGNHPDIEDIVIMGNFKTNAGYTLTTLINEIKAQGYIHIGATKTPYPNTCIDSTIVNLCFVSNDFQDNDKFTILNEDNIVVPSGSVSSHYPIYLDIIENEDKTITSIGVKTVEDDGKTLTITIPSEDLKFIFKSKKTSGHAGGAKTIKLADAYDLVEILDKNGKNILKTDPRFKDYTIDIKADEVHIKDGSKLLYSIDDKGTLITHKDDPVDNLITKKDPKDDTKFITTDTSGKVIGISSMSSDGKITTTSTKTGEVVSSYLDTEKYMLEEAKKKGDPLLSAFMAEIGPNNLTMLKPVKESILRDIKQINTIISNKLKPAHFNDIKSKIDDLAKNVIELKEVEPKLTPDKVVIKEYDQKAKRFDWVEDVSKREKISINLEDEAKGLEKIIRDHPEIKDIMPSAQDTITIAEMRAVFMAIDLKDKKLKPNALTDEIKKSFIKLKTKQNATILINFLKEQSYDPYDKCVYLDQIHKNTSEKKYVEEYSNMYGEHCDVIIQKKFGQKIEKLRQPYIPTS